MKAIKKTLTIVLAVAMIMNIISVCSFAALADPKAPRTLTALADKTEYAAGDAATFEVKLSTSEATSSLTYRLAIPDVFVITAGDGYNEDVALDYNVNVPLFVDHTWIYEEYFGSLASKRWSQETINASEDMLDGYTVITFTTAGQNNIKEARATVDMIVGRYNLEVAADAKPGDYEIYLYDAFTGYSDDTGTVKVNSTVVPVTVTIAGGEDDKTPAEKINLLTANGVAKSDVYVTNNDGSKYYVDSALVFVSSVDKGNAPVKTVITCDDFADTKLEIEAVHTQDINGLTYFAAAMSSIKETNRGLTFKATAYVTNADGEEVVGVPATGIFPK